MSVTNTTLCIYCFLFFQSVCYSVEDINPFPLDVNPGNEKLGIPPLFHKWENCGPQKSKAYLSHLLFSGRELLLLLPF